MSQYILINRIQVQNANAIAGFTWGFPAITHFLGFGHSISRKLLISEFKDIALSGCAVISHNHHVHTYKSSYDFGFTQSRNPPYLASHAKYKTPPIIEEGKMNMVVSLLMKCEGNIGNRTDNFTQWLNNICSLQRLAGGTILDIKSIEVFNLSDETLRFVKRKLLPGFILLDKSNYLESHYRSLQSKNQEAELFDAWIDFIAFKQKARPRTDEINKHLQKLGNDNTHYKKWQSHLDNEYQQNNIHKELQDYFKTIEQTKSNKKLLDQWQEYCNPTEKTLANWEYLKKPEAGYLVPIMTGYKAISEVYKNNEVNNTRDSQTDVCFVESAHSIGEWRSVHRFNADDLSNSVWDYHYENNWYLCTQNQVVSGDVTDSEIISENPDNSLYS